MPEYGFSLTGVFPCKGRIEDSVLIREYNGQRKPIIRHNLRNINTISCGFELLDDRKFRSTYFFL